MGKVWRLGYVPSVLFPVFFVTLSFGNDLAAVGASQSADTSDRPSIDFDLQAVPRREVLDRLFADQEIKLEWLNREVADEPVSGKFSGSLPVVARQLLARTNFVLLYQQQGDALRITRVLIVGKASDQASSGLQAIEAALRAPDKSQASPKAKSVGETPLILGGGSLPSTRTNAPESAGLPKPMPAHAGEGPVPSAKPVRANVVPPTSNTTAGLPSVAPIRNPKPPAPQPPLLIPSVREGSRG
ncbi:MAG: hypothetical protein QOD40_1274 [Alphaproteobacteria bacterium]|jgi:hypothetical protein|nr:hypothetical protein [Alphaproteobacteria bacterium]